ncbi:MAG: hypothetical protein WBP85_11205 [Terracidiphilus sp.]
MRPENLMRLEKIKKASRILRVVCKVLMGLSVLVFLPACIALLINKGGTIRSFNTTFIISELTMPSRLLLVAVTAATFGIVFNASSISTDCWAITRVGKSLPRSPPGTSVSLGLPASCGES